VLLHRLLQPPLPVVPRHVTPAAQAPAQQHLRPVHPGHLQRRLLALLQPQVQPPACQRLPQRLALRALKAPQHLLNHGAPAGGLLLPPQQQAAQAVAMCQPAARPQLPVLQRLPQPQAPAAQQQLPPLQRVRRLQQHAPWPGRAGGVLPPGAQRPARQAVGVVLCGGPQQRGKGGVPLALVACQAAPGAEAAAAQHQVVALLRSGPARALEPAWRAGRGQG
jgi:hypothetical protein